jgi:hypothetical protein
MDKDRTQSHPVLEAAMIDVRTHIAGILSPVKMSRRQRAQIIDELERFIVTDYRDEQRADAVTDHELEQGTMT